MSMTKYIAPAVMIGAGIATGGVSTLASGALIAGGAMNALGQASGSKDLTNAGTLVGGLGGLGELTGVGTSAIDSGNIFGSATAAIPGAPAGAVAQDASGNFLDASGKVLAPASASGPFANQLAANNAALTKLGEYNLIAGVAGGIGNAYTQQQQAEMQRQLEQQRMAIANTAAGPGGIAPAVTGGGTGLLSVAPPVVPRANLA